MGGLHWFAITHSRGDHFHDPAGAIPVLLDVIRSLFRSQVPGDVTAVADLVIRGQERHLAFSTQLIADLPVQSFLVGFHRQ